MTTHKENNVNVDSVVQGQTPETLAMPFKVVYGRSRVWLLDDDGNKWASSSDSTDGKRYQQLADALANNVRLREALQTIAKELQQSNGGKGPTGGLTTHLHDLAKAALSGAGK